MSAPVARWKHRGAPIRLDLEGIGQMIFANVQAFKASGLTPAVCIVGSGPAGISLALKLEQRKIPCLIIEAGGFEYSHEAQDACKGRVVGDQYFDLSTARLRQFGGTSGHWEGWCRPLDDVDCEARASVEKSGWPIRKGDLDPHAEQTESILEVKRLPKDKDVGYGLNEIHFAFSPPVRFGEKYKTAIANSPLIGLLLNSPVVDLVPVRGRISHVTVRTPANTNQQVSAPYFALCAGGIENSRMLLWANRRNQGGVVPQASTLGRYWMEHPHSIVGEALLFDFTGLRADRGMRFYGPTSTFLRSSNVGNFGMRLMVGDNLAKALVKDGICHSPRLFQELAAKLKGESLCGAVMQLVWEQLPDRDNRVELDDDLDPIGMPRAKLFWRRTAQDRRTAAQAIRMVGGYLAQTDLGRVKMAPWLMNDVGFPQDGGEMAGFHHMGGTRMSSSPSDGVVDAHCKVFGVDNLYVGGSSVFPTGGHANPTYTIVQLALRLGDHLAARVGKAA